MGEQVCLLAKEAYRLGILCAPFIGVARDLCISTGISRISSYLSHRNYRYFLAVDRDEGSSRKVELVARAM